MLGWVAYPLGAAPVRGTKCWAARLATPSRGTSPLRPLLTIWMGERPSPASGLCAVAGPRDAREASHEQSGLAGPARWGSGRVPARGSNRGGGAMLPEDRKRRGGAGRMWWYDLSTRDGELAQASRVDGRARPSAPSALLDAAWRAGRLEGTLPHSALSPLPGPDRGGLVRPRPGTALPDVPEQPRPICFEVQATLRLCALSSVRALGKIGPCCRTRPAGQPRPSGSDVKAKGSRVGESNLARASASSGAE